MSGPRGPGRRRAPPARRTGARRPVAAGGSRSAPFLARHAAATGSHEAAAPDPASTGPSAVSTRSRRRPPTERRRRDGRPRAREVRRAPTRPDRSARTRPRSDTHGGREVSRTRVVAHERPGRARAAPRPPGAASPAPGPPRPAPRSREAPPPRRRRRVRPGRPRHPARPSRRASDGKPGHALAALPAPGWSTTASPDPIPAPRATLGRGPVVLRRAERDAVARRQGPQRRQGLEEMAACVTSSPDGGAARATTTGPRSGRGSPGRPGPLPRTRTRSRRASRRRRAPGIGRLDEESVQSEALQIPRAIDEARAREERHEPGRDGQRRAEPEATQVRQRGTGQQHVAERARDERPGSAASRGGPAPGNASRSGRAPAGSEVAHHQEEACLAGPPAEERAAEDVREEVRVEHDPRGANAGGHGEDPGATPAGRPGDESGGGRERRRGVAGREAMVVTLPEAGPVEEPPARRRGGRRACPTPQPSTSRGRARHATCFTTWVASPASRTPATPPIAPGHICGVRRPVSQHGQAQEPPVATSVVPRSVKPFASRRTSCDTTWRNTRS